MHDPDILATTPMDDPGLAQAMAVVDTLTPQEVRALVCTSVWAAQEHARDRDVEHLTKHARDLLATLRLRGIPEYAEAVRSPRVRRSGGSLDIREVLASLHRQRPAPERQIGGT